MNLTINQVPAQFTLEREQTVRELEASLREWAQGEGHAVLSVLVDGRACLGAVLDQPLAQVGQVEIETVPLAAESGAHLAILGQYLSLVVGAAQAGNSSLLAELEAEYASMRGVLVHHLGSDTHLSASLGRLDRPWAAGDELAKAAERVRSEAARRAEEEASPAEAFAASLHRLGGLGAGLGELSVLWQRGRDQEAMDVLLGLLGTLDDLDRVATRALQAVGSTYSWAEFRASLDPFLAEAEAALRSRDYVLLGDLVEYEVAPRLEACREAVSGHFILDRSGQLP